MGLVMEVFAIGEEELVVDGDGRELVNAGFDGDDGD